MALLIRFLLLAICAAGLAEKVGVWTLENFGRYCDQYGAVCAYHFSIVEDNFSESGPRDTWPCTFTVLGENGKAANETDFQDVPCSAGLPVYRVNGGWNSDGYMVVVVTNLGDQAYAFFGYKDKDLVGGKSVDVETRPAYVVGTYDGNVITPRGAEEANTSWEVLGLQRQRTSSDSVILMEFRIRHDDDLVDHCTLIVQAPDGQNAQSWSFYGQECEDSDWCISWAYGDGDSAVMTVVNPEKTMNAWFGWDHVNDHEVLPDSGPSPVHPCNCG